MLKKTIPYQIFLLSLGVYYLNSLWLKANLVFLLSSLLIHIIIYLFFMDVTAREAETKTSFFVRKDIAGEFQAAKIQSLLLGLEVLFTLGTISNIGYLLLDLFN